MASDDQVPGPAPTFELERFDWLTPDRLAVSGTFGGLGQMPAEASPVLVLHDGEGVHRLPAIVDSLDGPPKDGQVWQAAFAWQDAPVAFDGAALELGEGVVIELPDPGAKRDERVSSIGSQIDLLAAQEELRDVRVELERTQAELTRARDDLRAERERRAGDSERFRDGLAEVRESAEEALQTLRGQLESAAEESVRLHAELKAAGDAINQARNDAERLLDRLTTVPAQ